MSTRAIAPVVGIQHSAVAKDLRREGVSSGHISPAPTGDDGLTDTERDDMAPAFP